MPRSAATFKQDDLMRALRGAQAAGCAVRRAEIDRNGKIVLVLVDELSEAAAAPKRPADIVL